MRDMGKVIDINAGKDEFAVCTECQSLITKEDGPRTRIWYNNFCGALKREKQRDPFDGMMKYAETNDLGRLIFTDEAYPYARDINTDGNCTHYKRKEGKVVVGLRTVKNMVSSTFTHPTEITEINRDTGKVIRHYFPKKG